MTIKEYCESCKNKGSHKCHSCMGRYYNGVLQGEPTKYIKKPQTNADRIRSMTDEELANLLLDGCRGSECDKQPHNEYGSVNCFQCRMDWLQSHAEVSDNA